MRINTLLFGASIFLAADIDPASAFQSSSHAAISARRSSSSTIRYSDDSDSAGYEIRTESRQQIETTSFGAENVPVDQRPSNEYLNLIRQPTFGWASQDSGDIGLSVRLAILYVTLFGLVCYPIAGSTYIQDGFLMQKLTSSNVGAISVVFVMVLRLYSGWGYIGSRYVPMLVIANVALILIHSIYELTFLSNLHNRLQSKVIEYEETGWYDGDMEEKSDAEKARDLFLYRSNVKPVSREHSLFCSFVHHDASKTYTLCSSIG